MPVAKVTFMKEKCRFSIWCQCGISQTAVKISILAMLLQLTCKRAFEDGCSCSTQL